MRRRDQKNRTRIGPHLRQPRTAESQVISVAKIGYVRRSEFRCLGNLRVKGVDGPLTVLVVYRTKTLAPGPKPDFRGVLPAPLEPLPATMARFGVGAPERIRTSTFAFGAHFFDFAILRNASP
jgi:hypothetical protein